METFDRETFDEEIEQSDMEFSENTDMDAVYDFLNEDEENFISEDVLVVEPEKEESQYRERFSKFEMKLCFTILAIVLIIFAVRIPLSQIRKAEDVTTENHYRYISLLRPPVISSSMSCPNNFEIENKSIYDLDLVITIVIKVRYFDFGGLSEAVDGHKYTLSVIIKAKETETVMVEAVKLENRAVYWTSEIVDVRGVKIG